MTMYLKVSIWQARFEYNNVIALGFEDSCGHDY
jgi:hypothetical protein